MQLQLHTERGPKRATNLLAACSLLAGAELQRLEARRLSNESESYTPQNCNDELERVVGSGMGKCTQYAGVILYPLHGPAGFGRVDSSVRCILGTGFVDKNMQDDLGYTPPHDAAMNGCIDVVRDLLAAGADCSRRCRTWGQTALYLAAATGRRVNVVRAIVEHRADVNAVDRCGVTALHVAASYHDKVEVLEVLVKAAASIEQERHDGRTPLHASARNNRPAAVHTAMLRHGASIRKQDGSGRSPLHLAVAYPGFSTVAEVVDLLLRWGADDKAKDGKGLTAAETKC